MQYYGLVGVASSVAFQLLEQSPHHWLPAHTALGDPRAQRHVEEDCPTHEKGLPAEWLVKYCHKAVHSPHLPPSLTNWKIPHETFLIQSRSWGCQTEFKTTCESQNKWLHPFSSEIGCTYHSVIWAMPLSIDRFRTCSPPSSEVSAQKNTASKKPVQHTQNLI